MLAKVDVKQQYLCVLVVVLQSTHKGLSNKRGENNCFLNGVLQVLWHNKTFRKLILSVQDHTCPDSPKPSSSPSTKSPVPSSETKCVFCSLKNLFLEYQFSDSAQIPSTALRKTLAIIYKPENKFQLNAMDDSAECLEAILQRLHADLATSQLRKKTKPSGNDHHHHHHASSGGKPPQSSQAALVEAAIRRENTVCNPACVAHNVFGLNILEQSVCSCGSTTEPLCYSSFVQYFNVPEVKAPWLF